MRSNHVGQLLLSWSITNHANRRWKLFGPIFLYEVRKKTRSLISGPKYFHHLPYSLKPFFYHIYVSRFFQISIRHNFIVILSDYTRNPQRAALNRVLQVWWKKIHWNFQLNQNFLTIKQRILIFIFLPFLILYTSIIWLAFDWIGYFKAVMESGIFNNLILLI